MFKMNEISEMIVKIYEKKTNLLKFQKEPPLNAKMRRDGTITVVNVKTERTSTDARIEKPKSAEDKENEPERPVRIKKEKVDESIASKSTANKTTKRSTEVNGSKKTTNDDSNDSLEILPMETNPTIELSDEENSNDGSKMPPPAFVPPIKPTKEKKAPVEKKTRSTRSKQPKRKVSLTVYKHFITIESIFPLRKHFVIGLHK